MSTDYKLGRRGRAWVAIWYDGGKRHRFRLNATTKADALGALRVFARNRELLRNPVREVTVEGLWNEYVSEKTAQDKIAVPRIQDAWKALATVFGSLPPDNVSSSLVRSYTAGRRSEGRSDGTIHTELGYLRASLRFAAKRGIIDNAPHIELPPKPRPKGRHLTSDEARRLIDAAKMPHMRLYIALALFTAGRPSSILDLEWSRVDMHAMRIQLDNPARDRTAKGRATVPIAPELVDQLRDAHAAALTNHVIEWAGSRVASVKKGIREAARRAGLIEVTPYVLRHTAAVWMAEAGVPMSEISQYLGHTSTAVTERVYARYSPAHLRRGSDAISSRLTGTKSNQAQ